MLFRPVLLDFFFEALNLAARASPAQADARPSAEPLTRDLIAEAYRVLAATFDSDHGGLGPAPKFPPNRGTPVVMHRWMLLKSSGPVLPCHPAATASCRRRASGVTRGIRPSGGSTTSEVLLSNTRSTIPRELLVDDPMEPWVSTSLNAAVNAASPAA